MEDCQLHLIHMIYSHEEYSPFSISLLAKFAIKINPAASLQVNVYLQIIKKNIDQTYMIVSLL